MTASQEAARLLRLARAEAEDDLPTLAAVECDLAYVTHTHEGIPVADAYARAALATAQRLGDPGLLAESLAVATVVGFLCGRGIDEPALERAPTLEDVTRRVPAPMRPSVIYATQMFWSGRSAPLWRRCATGSPSEATRPPCRSWRSSSVSTPARAVPSRRPGVTRRRAWRPPTASARTSCAHALTAQAAADTHAGSIKAARQAAEQAAALFTRVGCRRWATWPLSVPAFVHLSTDDAPAAARLLGPLVEALPAEGIEEPAAASFLSDAIEALSAAGDLDTAEATLRWFLRHGDADVQPWVAATGRRCRGLLRAARGDVEGALSELEQALVAHAFLPHPVEHARTLPSSAGSSAARHGTRSSGRSRSSRRSTPPSGPT
jgi:hypothetical protein